MDPELQRLFTALLARRPPGGEPADAAAYNPGPTGRNRVADLFGNLRAAFDPTTPGFFERGVPGFLRSVIEGIQRDPLGIEAYREGTRLAGEGRPVLGSALQAATIAGLAPGAGAVDDAARALPRFLEGATSAAVDDVLRSLPRAAPTGEATLRLRHYGPGALEDVLRTARQGSGQPGAEMARRAAVPEEYAARTHFYVGDTPAEARFAGQPSVEVSADPGLFLDARRGQTDAFVEAAGRTLEAQGLPAGGNRLITRAEALAKEAGYEGIIGADGRAVKFTDTVNPGTPNNRILEATAQNGGATFTPGGEDLFGKPLISVAARAGDDFVAPATERGTASLEDLSAFREKFADDLAKPGHNIGTWRRPAKPGETAGPSGDVVVMDVVRTFDESKLAEAEALGRKNGQDALFNLGTGEEIKLAPETIRAASITLPNGDVIEGSMHGDVFNRMTPEQ